MAGRRNEPRLFSDREATMMPVTRRLRLRDPEPIQREDSESPTRVVVNGRDGNSLNGGPIGRRLSQRGHAASLVRRLRRNGPPGHGGVYVLYRSPGGAKSKPASQASIAISSKRAGNMVDLSPHRAPSSPRKIERDSTGDRNSRKGSDANMSFASRINSTAHLNFSRASVVHCEYTSRNS